MAHQEAYDKHPGLRRSDLWQIHISPKHFKFLMDNRHLTSSNSKDFGIAMHKYLLEPNTFYDEFAIAPAVDRRTKVGKETWNNFITQCAADEKTPIDQSDFQVIQEMTAAALSNPLVAALLQGPKETECYWTDPNTQEELKAKMDCVTVYEGKDYIVDYKTTDSCQDGHFERSSSKYGYQFQTGFYTEGMELMNQKPYGFIFIAQEKKPPYACRVYICSDMYLAKGKEMFHDYLNLYHLCKMTNNWYGYEGSDTTPKPTILQDDTERYAMRRANQFQQGYQSTQFGFYESSDDDTNDMNDID